MSSSNSAPAVYPRDVLLAIFSLTLPSSEQFKQRHSALTALRLVCYHWNAVVEFNAIFWSTIDISIPSQVIPQPALALWFDRSLDAALDISMKDTPPTNWTPSEIGLRTEFLSAIQSHLSHCRSLQLEISFGILPAFRNLQLAEAHRLEYFSVNMKGNTDADVHQNMIRQLCSLPNLHHLSCTSNYPLFTTSLLHHASPSWLSRLRHIEVSCPISSDEMVQLLNQCTFALSLTLNYVRPSSSNYPAPLFDPVKLSNLRVLDITLHSDVYQTLFHNFSFPNLKILKIQGPTMSDLSFTLNHLSPSLKLLKFNISLHRFMHPQLSAFLKHENIRKIPILEMECRQYEIWDEYEGWGGDENVTVFDSGASKEAFCELIDELNRQLSQDSGNAAAASLGGSHADRLVKYDKDLDLCHGWFIGWVDSGLCMKNWKESVSILL
ncbi:hypothetical protein AGABI1DRAFT_132249 [Agaricus bisporus var. burnettii JB137-S8]|uniref:Uncharacterized protein n=1 Tax=Agaricus bisporus var. burnettii (strain JB137-S8 / ATCC MYA-4627 / FGSC 10392) TaxID=597362 RepID=K5WXY2_AGABU|nr:uncharacterized protein AGABI1DRAFT_132249 [Agaricus bisporus var. burnettii JB137-S8]EKM75462.1 hypothetical protein AGABI1DRAFT_132249 [Agaricus bisporus var. burnettii JB137-S8]